jgi:AraC-like DNA-binding protein
VAHSAFTETGLRYACLIVDTRFLLENGINVSALRLSEAIDDAEAAARFSEIVEEYARTGDFAEAGIRAAVLRLLVHLCRNHSAPSESRDAPDTAGFLSVCTAIAFVKSNFSSRITLDAVAASTGLTKYHFLRKFKRITGLTVLEYINTVRCQHARQLLAGGASAKEAAIRSGFGNFSHFSSVFKKYTGTLPSKIKNQKSP